MNPDCSQMALEKYSLEPYYGQQVTNGNNTINYILRIPQPLDYEQMKIILMVIKEMRRPRDYTTDKITVTDFRQVH